LGEKLRELREGKGFLLRQVAAYLEVDTAFVSKIEHGEKRPVREQLLKLAVFLEANEDQLITYWLCDKIIFLVGEDPLAITALKLALKTLTAK